MKKQLKIISSLMLALLMLNACEKEEDESPVITEVVAKNHDNESKEISLGGTIMVNFTAEARGDARLDYYHIEIHDHPASGNVEDEYKIIDDDFKNESEFKGLKKTPVHKHVDVPETANLGKYHVVIIVVDDKGYATDTEALKTEIEIIE
ncbi:MAG: DUF4625 domain-containing protein [Bacteroidetes bacterium]|jgi:hypothetical protein|nr:DUF4625 domain-containing protein [Bacteroidota bacterium]